MSTPNHKRPGNYGLPEDIIIEILLILSVKTLLRLKCVCKKWNTIIASHSFVNQHYVNGSNKECLLVGCLKRDEFGNICIRANALSLDDTLSAFEEPAHLQIHNEEVEVMGAVNGVLFLVGESNELALLNPATRQLKPLPKRPDLLVLEPHYRFHCVLGFGLDPLSGDFKVVSILYLLDKNKETRVLPPLVSVYSSGSDSWKNVASFKSDYTPHSSIHNTYLNGVYYWTLGIWKTVGILAFDMSTEKFEKIDVPDCVKSGRGYLFVRGDSLALLRSTSQYYHSFQVWVMEKEGNWNYVAVIGPFPEIICPLFFWKNNELLLNIGAPAVLAHYNFCTKKKHPVAALLEQKPSWALSYTESLVSIKGEGDCCMLWDTSADMLWVKEH